MWKMSSGARTVLVANPPNPPRPPPPPPAAPALSTPVRRPCPASAASGFHASCRPFLARPFGFCLLYIYMYIHSIHVYIYIYIYIYSAGDGVGQHAVARSVLGRTPLDAKGLARPAAARPAIARPGPGLFFRPGHAWPGPYRPAPGSVRPSIARHTARRARAPTSTRRTGQRRRRRGSFAFPARTLAQVCMHGICIETNNDNKATYNKAT